MRVAPCLGFGTLFGEPFGWGLAGAVVSWCAGRDIEPLRAQRAQLELYVRWMQETRRYKPSTVSRRSSVVSGFYRTAVIDGVLAHSRRSTSADPASHPSRPHLA